MSYIGNQDYTVIETHVGSIEGKATAAAILVKPYVDGQVWAASDTGDLYISDGYQWVNIGKLKGDKGDLGDTGVGIANITKTGTTGAVDTYTVNYTDATSDTITITNANTWLTGTSIPDDGVGIDGDLYLDTAINYYYKKVTGTWALQGTLRGAAYGYDAVGTLAGRAAYDLEALGFGYLALGTTPTLYYKTSASSGSWDSGTAVGKGEKGTSVVGMAFTSTTDISGLAGMPGATDTYTTTFDDGSTSTYTVQNGANGAVMSVAGRSGDVVLTKADVGLTNVDNTSDADKPVSTAMQLALDDKSDDTHTHTEFTGLAVTGLTATGLKETAVSMAANDINLATGNLFTKTISGATTLTVSNVPTSGTVGYFILQLTNGGSATVTWFSGVKWAGGTAPTLTASGVDVLSFYTIDAGTTWKVVGISKDVK